MDKRATTVSDPPRRVPFGVRVRLGFGGTANLILWITTLLGIIGTGSCVANSEAISRIEFSGPLAQTTGTVTTADETGYGEEGDPGVFKVCYGYHVRAAEHRGCSYVVGPLLWPGMPAVVDYIVDRPDRSRLRGHRARIFPGVVVWVPIFPLLSFCLIVIGWFVSGWPYHRLLRRGALAWGTLVSREEIKGDSDGATSHRLTFRFTIQPPEGGAYRGAPIQHEASWEIDAGDLQIGIEETDDIDHLTDEETAPLLYDPKRPARCWPLGAFPFVSLDPAGQFVSSTRSWPLLVLPLVCAGLVAAAAGYIVFLIP